MLVVNIKKLLTAIVNFLINSPYIQHIIEHIVGNYNAARLRNPVCGFEFAQIEVRLHKGRIVEKRTSRHADFFGNDIQDGSFAAAVAAVEYGNGRVKIHPHTTLQRKDIERIKRPVTRHLRLIAKRNEIVFVVLARK